MLFLVGCIYNILVESGQNGRMAGLEVDSDYGLSADAANEDWQMMYDLMLDVQLPSCRSKSFSASSSNQLVATVGSPYSNSG